MKQYIHVNKEWVKKQIYEFYHNDSYKNGELAFYRCADKTIDEIALKLKSNINVPNIKSLLMAINKLWSTQAEKDRNSIDDYSKGIFKHKREVFKSIKSGKTDIVHTILTKYTKNHNYNVALISKFCCKCNEKAFPISDKFVREFLANQNRSLRFCKRLSKKSLQSDYRVFANAIKLYVKEKNFNDFKYRKLDLAIWTYMKMHSK